MTEARVPIFRTIMTAAQDLFDAVRAMPLLGAWAFMLIFLAGAADTVLEAASANEQAALHWPFFRTGVVVLLFFFLAPVGIALFRYILLGEISERYTPDISSQRFREFFIYSALINLPATVLMDFSIKPDIVTIPAALAMTFAFPAATLLLFPAIAVDAPGASLWNAVRDSHFWRTFLMLFLVCIPAFVLNAGLLIWFDATPNAFTVEWLIFIALAAIADFLALASNVVAAPLYRAWAIRLKGL